MNEESRIVADYILSLIITIGKLEQALAAAQRELADLKKLAEAPPSQEN